MGDSPSSAALPPWRDLPRPLLLALAVLLCLATTLYALLWISDARHPGQHLVGIGFNQSRDTFFDPATSSIHIYNVKPDSPAEHAGLQAGDQITRLNGKTLTSYALFHEIWSHAKPGDGVDVTVRRAGEPRPLTFHVIFRSVEAGRAAEGLARESAQDILNFYPIFFVLVGFAVLFLRLDDGHAWLLALLFAGFVAAPSFANQIALPDLPRIFTSLYRAIFYSLLTAFFYIFFALFPQKSPLERRAPGLKWMALAVAASILLPVPFSEAPTTPG
jgi:PDZ domain